jgi:hypothetical protein
MSHGTANTSLQCSSASHAVISVPLFIHASGMMMPSESAATISLRIGNIYGSDFVSIGNIETSAHPVLSIFSNNLEF